MSSQAAIDKFLPLTEPTVFILLCLSHQPRHGYGIMKDVQALSEGRINLSTGTLYGALRRLLHQGWIERVEDTSPAGKAKPSRRPRRAYGLTKLGHRILEAETSRLQHLAALTRLRSKGAKV